jgi:hypothetical protein
VLFLGFPGAAVGVVRVVLVNSRKAVIAYKNPLPRIIDLNPIEDGGSRGAAIALFLPLTSHSNLPMPSPKFQDGQKSFVPQRFAALQSRPP